MPDLQALIDRLAELEAHATPGPWADYSESYPQGVRKYGAGWHGRGMYTKPFLALIARSRCRGEAIVPERDFPSRVDLWDLDRVVCIPWPKGKTYATTTDGLVSECDRTFIAKSRNALPLLLAMAREALAWREWWADQCDEETVQAARAETDRLAAEASTGGK